VEFKKEFDERNKVYDDLLYDAKLVFKKEAPGYSGNNNLYMKFDFDQTQPIEDDNFTPSITKFGNVKVSDVKKLTPLDIDILKLSVEDRLTKDNVDPIARGQLINARVNDLQNVFNLHAEDNKLFEYFVVNDCKGSLIKMNMTLEEAKTNKLLSTYVNDDLQKPMDAKKSKFLPFDSLTSPVGNEEDGTFDDEKYYTDYDIPELKKAYTDLYNDHLINITQSRNKAIASLGNAEFEGLTNDIPKHKQDIDKYQTILDNFYYWFHTNVEYPGIPVTHSKMQYVKPEYTEISVAKVHIRRKNCIFRYGTQNGLWGLNVNNDVGLFVKPGETKSTCIYRIDTKTFFDGTPQYIYPPMRMVFLQNI